jgi:hypothetical protein
MSPSSRIYLSTYLRTRIAGNGRILIRSKLHNTPIYDRKITVNIKSASPMALGIIERALKDGRLADLLPLFPDSKRERKLEDETF